MPPSHTPHASAAVLRPLPEPAYELRVQPRDDIGYGIALYRRGSAPYETESGDEQVVRVWGDPLLTVMDQVLAVIRRAGYGSTDLAATRRAPFRIAEDDAVRLGLLFAALKPLRKYRRIEEVAGAISSMEREEVYYWFSKVTTGSEQGRIQRALRIMVSDE